MGCGISVTSDFLTSSAHEQNTPLLPDELIMQTAAGCKMIDTPVVGKYFICIDSTDQFY
jgi:hypothetical protein